MNSPMPTALRALPVAIALFAHGCAQGPGDAADAPLPAGEPAPQGRVLPAPTGALGGYLAARHARLHRDMEAAHLYIVRALADEPDNPDLLETALTSALAERDTAAAGEFARRLAAAAPDSGVARVALATAAVIAGDHAAAAETAAGIPRTGIGRYIVPLLRAWTLAGLGDADGALAALEPLASRSAFAGVRDYHAALIAELLGRPQAAETAFAGALGAQRGGALRAVLAAGGFHLRAGRPAAARAAYDAFLDANPDTVFLDAAYGSLEEGANSPPPLIADARAGYAEALYNAAASLAREDAVEAALVYAQLCLSAREDHDACRMLLGDIFAESGRHADAAAEYEAVPAESPLKWTARLRAADTVAELGRIDAAAERLRGMAQERPERPAPLIAVADLMLNEKRYEEAAEAYDRALARIPTLETRHWPLLYARGMSLERSDNWERAEGDFLRALELEPDQPLVLNYLGYSWIEMGRNYARARGMIEKAVKQRPNDGYIVDSLGWVLYRLGEYGEAVVQLERAASLRPGDPVILDHFGDALWRVGRRNEARFQWLRALSFEPEPELESALRGKLDNGLAPEPETAPPAVETEDL